MKSARDEDGKIIIDDKMRSIIAKHIKAGMQKRKFKAMARKSIMRQMKGKYIPSRIAQEQKDSDEAVDILWAEYFNR